jgi:hypothetical protein
LAAALAAYPASQHMHLRALALAFGALSLVFLLAGLASRSGQAIGLGLTALAGGYAVLFATRGSAIDELTPVYAAGFLLVAELAFWSLEPRIPAWSEPGLLDRRLGYLAVECVAAAGLAALAVLAASAARGGGVGLEAVGVVAAIGAVVLVASSVRSASLR